MYLYKLEAVLGGRGAVTLIVMGESDAEAMEQAEVHLEKHFVGKQDVRELVLIEKRRAVKGAAYVIEHERP
ncbi:MULTISPECIES: DUF3906 family protein [Cohnella]|jgi:hypothetical protein|uniref:DUF3906 family protein n=1 Tax=Cohnella TaxID=329857 RepID=UPI00037AEC63|nr:MULTISPECIES: DUF3906 family protein [Cohnella]REK63150.1 MAG: DUF3906 domain-containing protein [Cohnella sp.]